MSELLYLAHHGTKGMHWYDRKYQNKDGSLTPLGRVHYGVGKAREKVKTTVGDLKKQRSVSKELSSKNRKKMADERAERKESRRIEKIEKKAKKQARRIARAETMMTYREMLEVAKDSKNALTRQRIESLLKKQDRIKEAAELKAQEKALRKELKDLKKNAEKDASKKYSRKQIKSMSDDEINNRINRLRKEAELVSLENSRNVPNGLRNIGNALLDATTQGVKELAKDSLTKLGRQYLGLDIQEETPASRAKMFKDLLDERRAKDDLENYERNKKDADRQARIKSNRDALEEKKSEDALKNYSKNRADEELARAATRAKNTQTIANTRNSPKESADESEKRYGTEVTKRKENERRAENFKKNGLTVKEIAKRMNLSVNQVKDLLYMK